MAAKRQRPPIEKTPQEHAVEQTLSPSLVEPPVGRVPTAAKTGGRPGLVKSPFPPHGELDVSGMASGSLARDPVSGKLFRVP